jgi:hypothetical protein
MPGKKLRWLSVTTRHCTPPDLDLPLRSRRRWVEVVPQIRMSGMWLAAAGFIPGCGLTIAVRRGRLVITVVAPPLPRQDRRYGE